ncbi:hypothetical protein DPEC_G00097970 [Dallia pectoralis]|uniref:Uncharacterized protein n=1 Tax=Dallia pectoralis TaxID=75939 RepID=A0ACC2GVW8_DALPE|nr:hypothetical protein DPEC_G00097970 [Dallia pectoralis]
MDAMGFSLCLAATTKAYRDQQQLLLMVFLLTDMLPVASLMDYRSECSGASISGEDCPSPSESERGGKGRSLDRSGKKKANNRDSARKSRKKQTERADILHQELQTLERSNSALEKEITALRREFQHYTVTLERHQPLCCLRPSPIPQDTPSSPPLPVSKSSSFPTKAQGLPYPLTLLTSANEHPVEFSLSDILDSPDWLCEF